MPSNPAWDANLKMSSNSKLYREAVEILNSAIVHHPSELPIRALIPSEDALDQNRGRIITGKHSRVTGLAGAKGLLHTAQAFIASFQHTFRLLGEAGNLIQFAVNIFYGMVEVREQQIYLGAGVIQGSVDMGKAPAQLEQQSYEGKTDEWNGDYSNDQKDRFQDLQSCSFGRDLGVFLRKEVVFTSTPRRV
jgi:hypothetical protein